MEPFLLFGILMYRAWSFRTPMILLLLVLYNETRTRPSNTKKPLDSAAFCYSHSISEITQPYSL